MGTAAVARENGKKGGRPKGKRSAATLERDKVLAAVRQRIMQKADKILNAQFSIAQGQQFLYKIEKTKIVGPKGGISYRNEKPKLVTSQFEIQDYIDNLVDEANGDLEDENDPGATYYFITTKEPNNMAIDSMLDRTFDKARQGVHLSGGVTVSVDPKKKKEIETALDNVI